MIQKTRYKNESIKYLRNHLACLTNELNRITESIQILELQDDVKLGSISDLKPEHEIGQLLKKQNTVSHEIILVKKRIRQLSAKTILKIELVILPIVVVLLFFMVSNYVFHSTDVNFTAKTQYMVENIHEGTTADYEHWNLASDPSLSVSLENNAHVSDQKIQSVKKAIMSTDVIKKSTSVSSNPEFATNVFFVGWKGAIQNIGNTKHPLPTQFNIMQSGNENGKIVIILSPVSNGELSSVTRNIVEENQILKSFIIVYGADKLTDGQMESIVRHEFGHALGLAHTSNTADLMHDSMTGPSYISNCDLNALEKSYDDIKPSDDFCK